MKKNVWKRLVVTSIALAMAVSLFPQAPVLADGQDSADEANGWVSWLPVTGDADTFYPPMQPENGKESQVEFSFVGGPVSHDGNGAIKAERLAAGGIQLHLDRENNIGATILPKRENKVVMMASAWVWADDDAAGSTLASYAFFDGSSNIEDGAHFNSAYNNVEVRTLQKGWQELYFDVTQCKSLGFLYWQSSKAGGVIYLDDFKLKYVGVNDPVYSFDNYTDDWNIMPRTDKYMPSQNTDSKYIKYGNGSLKIELVGKHGDSKDFLTSKLSTLPVESSTKGVNGKLLPKFEGYTAKNFGFWIYNDDVNPAEFSLGSTYFCDGDVEKPNVRATRISKPGWHYVNFEFANKSARYDNNEISVKKLYIHSIKTGTFYIDALTVEYEKNDEVVAERFESNSNWFGQSGNNITCYDYAALGGEGNGKYVKEGFTSAQLTLPKNTNYGDAAFTANGGMPTTVDARGNMPTKLGVWVYGNGNSGVQLGIDARVSESGAANVTEPVSIDFEGWRQIWFDLPENTASIYGIRYANTSNEDAVVYIDKMTYGYPACAELVNGNAKLDMTNVKLNDTIGYQVNFVQDGDDKKDMLLVIAAYDELDRLINVKAEKVQSGTDGITKGKAQMAVDSSELLGSIKRVKGFCWESGSLTPVYTEALSK